MFIVTEIHVPRSNGISLVPIPIIKIEKPFEEAIKQALFAFPYRPDYYYYVVCGQEENGTERFLLIIDPETLPNEGQLFVSVIDDILVVRKYNLEIHHKLKILGTVAQASKTASIHIEPL